VKQIAILLCSAIAAGFIAWMVLATTHALEPLGRLMGGT
jgi:hypothetical protein